MWPNYWLCPYLGVQNERFSALEQIKNLFKNKNKKNKKGVGYAHVKIAPSVCVDMRENYIHSNMRNLGWSTRLQAHLFLSYVVFVCSMQLKLCLTHTLTQFDPQHHTSLSAAAGECRREQGLKAAAHQSTLTQSFTCAERLLPVFQFTVLASRLFSFACCIGNQCTARRALRTR